MRRPGELEILTIMAVIRTRDRAYGVTVLEELERETSRILTLGTVYKTLLRLEEKGLLRSRTSDPLPERGGRKRRLYRVTPSGLDAVRCFLEDMRRMAKGLERPASPTRTPSPYADASLNCPPETNPGSVS